MSKHPYVVISDDNDGTIPYVERHLDEPFLRLNTRHVLTGKAPSYELAGGKTTVRRHSQLLSDVRGVWYRRLMLIQPFELPVDEGKQIYARDALKYYYRLLFAQFADALWVSDFFATERADDKLWQLQVAAKVGFHVADTLFTTSPEEAEAFVYKHPNVIAKANYSSSFVHNGKQYAFYTSRVDKDTDFSGFHLAPAILQEAIGVKTELRITVVGNKVFAASIHDHSKNVPSHIRDWRVANLRRQVTYKPYDLPKKLHDLCIGVIKELGLRFGAMDVIIDPQDRPWFLENNANGQWAFIEDATGQPIGKAHAELLMRGRAD